MPNVDCGCDERDHQLAARFDSTSGGDGATASLTGLGG